MYYAQGFYNAFFGGFLYSNDCEAWTHGPVYVDIYNKYKTFGSSNIEQFIDYDISEILDEDKKILIDVVVNSFGYYKGKALEEMTHFEQPWIQARKGIPTDVKSNEIITKDSISAYFNKVKDKYSMMNILEIKNYSLSQFNLAVYGKM